MSLVSELSKEDLKCICAEVIPSQMIADYFSRNPKEFQKIRPGFRAKKLKAGELSRILFDNCEVPFIWHFIDETIQRFLIQIDDHIQACINDGETTAQAYLHTLSNSFFRDNIALYAQLSSRLDLTQEAIEYIDAAISLEKHMQKEQKDTVAADEKADHIKGELEKKLQAREKELSKLSARMSKSEQDVSRLITELENLKTELADKNKQLTDFEENLARAEAGAKRDSKQIKELERGKIQLERQLAIEKQHVQDLEVEVAALRSQELQQKAKRQEPHLVYTPEDIGEFYEYLEYNLTDIGVSDLEPYKELLIHYLGKILFLGMPILTNRGVAFSIAQCVSNAVVGEKTFGILTYRDGISADEIQEFLCSSGRVVCLDGFVGNFNELELIPIVGAYRDKIIFLATVSERTVMCLATDFLLHCIYFNANRVGKLLRPCITNEDGTVIDEHPIESSKYQADEHYQKILDQIAAECQLPIGLTEHWKLGIGSEEELCQVLAFTLLPYCTDALYIKPFSVSPRLQKYTGPTGRCPYGDLLTRWFGR